MPRTENQHEFELVKAETIKEFSNHLDTLKTDKERIEWIAQIVMTSWDVYSKTPSSATLEGIYEGSYIVYQHELVRQGYLKQLQSWGKIKDEDK